MGKIGSILLSFAILLSTATYAQAENKSGQDKPDLSGKDAELKERVRLLEAEALEKKALAEKIEAETKLQEVIFKHKVVEELKKTDLQIELAKRAAKKAQSEAEQANAEASALEARLRQLKLATELKALEQSSQSICDSKAIAARYEKIDSEMKLAKLEQEKQSMLGKDK